MLRLARELECRRGLALVEGVMSATETASREQNQDRSRGRPHVILRLGLVGTVMAVTFLFSPLAAAQTPGTATIGAPAPGDVLRGVVQVQGTVDADGFASADLAFAYESDDTNTWFLIGEIDRPISNAELGTWDTSVISDGDYVLRLRVSSLAATEFETKVTVQVRNYTAPVLAAPSATPTEALVMGVPTPMVVVASPTSARVTPVAPTPLPANPAAISADAVYAGFGRAALLVTALVLMVGIAILRRRG